MQVLKDRDDAGRRLAGLLAHLAGQQTVVLALPRGGVPVAERIASALACPMTVLVVRKLGVPGHEEYGFGAIGEGGVRVLDDAVVTALGIDDAMVAKVERHERAELERRVLAYRGGEALPELNGRHVILVDDGIATGGTMRAAIATARKLNAARVVVATGVAPPETVAALAREADEVVSAITPAQLASVSQWYDDFPQVSDTEVLTILRRAGA